MNTLHTPGAWEVGKPFGLTGLEITAGNRTICGVIGTHRLDKAHDAQWGDVVDDAEGLANAALLLAAPILLAACIEAAKTFSALGATESHKVNNQILAAIKAATTPVKI